jgi:hypothetical protein
MRRFFFTVALLGVGVMSATAQDAVPDLKGTWTGKGKSIVFGNSLHHPGSQTTSEAPRVRDIEATHVIEGQDGRLAWGRTSSAAANTQEPLAWAISADNKSIIGADADGYYQISLLAPDRMEKCYVHNGQSPSRSIVASCQMMERKK